MKLHLVLLVLLAVLPGLTVQAQELEKQQGVARDAVLVYNPDFFAASRPATAEDMVERLPGFQLDNGDNVRGFAGAGGNVLIDGARPASKTDNVSSVLGRIQAGRVSHVELIRGGAPGIDMQGHSVVANVILSDEATRQQSLLARTYFFEGGPTLPSGRYEFSSSDNGTNWGFNIGRSLSINDSTGTGTLVRRDGSGQVTDIEQRENKFDGGGWSGRADWAAPVAAGRLEITGGASINDFEEWTQYVAPTSQRHFDFAQENRDADLGVRAEQNLSETMTLEARLIQNQRRIESVSSALMGTTLQRFNTERETGESIVRSVLRWQPTDRMKVESSAELAYNVLDTEQNFTVDGQNVALPQSTTKVNELRTEIAAIATWQRSDSLTLEAGARLERSRIRQSGSASAERSFFYPKPRLAMTWDFTENHQLRLRLERELGQLNFNDFAASSSLTNNEVLGGNLDLRPEQRWVSEAVLERRLSADAVLSLTLRHDEISHVVDVLPLEDGLTAIGNIGDGSLDRVELDLRLPLDRIGLSGGRLTLNARYDHARVNDPTTGRERQISDVRPFTGSANFEQDLPTWNLVWGLDYTPYFRETTFNPDQRRDVELRHYLTAFGEYTFSDSFTARVEYTVWDDFRINRQSWSDRVMQTIAFSEQERVNPRNFIQMRLRKTF